MDAGISNITGKLSRIIKLFNKYLQLISNKEIPPSKRVILLVKAIVSVQILTLIVPYQPSHGLPWNYSSLSWLWIVMHGVVRPDSLSEFVFNTPLAFFVFLAIVTFAYLLCLGLLIAKLKGEAQQDPDYSYAQQISGLTQTLSKLHQSMRLYLGDLLVIPIFYSSVYHLTFPNNLGANVDQLSYMYLSVLLLSLPKELLNSFILAKLNWNDGYNSISSPFLRLFFSFYLIALSSICGGTQYFKQPLLYPLLLILTSGIFLVVFCAKRPYFKESLNYISMGQGVMILYAAVVLCLAQLFGLNDQSDSFATIVYFLPLGPIMYLSKYYLQHLDALDREISKLRKSYDLEFILKCQVKRKLKDPDLETSDKRVKDMIVDASKMFKNDPIIMIWIVNYYMFIKERVYIKHLLAALMKYNSSLLYLNHVNYTRFRVMQFLWQFPEEREPYNFMEYKESLEEMLKKDEDTCRICFELYEEMARKVPKFRKLEKKVVSLINKMRDCKQTYKKVLGAYDKSPVIFDYFAGYLENIENNLKYKLYARKAYEVREEIERMTKNRNSDYGYFDMTNTLLIVSLDQDNFGSIVWSNNPENIGFTKLDLMDTKFAHLIDRSLERMIDLHTQLFKLNLNTDTASIFIDQSNCIINAKVKASLVNDLEGRLALLVSIKTQETQSKEYAILGRGNEISCMTRGFKYFLCEELKVPNHLTDFPKFLSLIPQDWIIGQVLLKHQYGNEQLVLETASLPTIFPVDMRMVILRVDDSQSALSFSSKEPTLGFKFDYADEIRHIRFLKAPKPAFNEKDHESESLPLGVTTYIKDNTPTSNFSTQNSSAESLIRASSKGFKAKLGRLITMLKLSLIMTNIFFAASCMTVNTIVKNLTDELSSNLDLSHQFGMMSLNVLNLAFRAKELYLMNKGISFENSEEVVRAEILSNIGFLQETLGEFRQDITDSENADNLVWINYVTGHYIEERESLYEIILQMETAAKKLYDTPIQEITETNREFLALYRNGPAEVTRALNNTISGFVEDSKVTVEETNTLIFSMILISGAVYISCVFAFSVPLLLLINTLRWRLWSLLAKLPISILKVGKMRAAERLHNLHSIEEESTTSNDRLAKDRIRYSSHPCQMMTYCCMVLLLAGLGVYIYLMQGITGTELYNVLKIKPDYIHWADMRRTLAQYSVFWMREIKNPDPLFVTYNFFYDEYISTIESIQKFAYAHKYIRKLSPPVNDEHRNFNFNYGCTAEICLPVLELGLQSTILEMQYSGYDFVQHIMNGEGYKESGGIAFEKNMAACIASIIASIKIYQQSTTDTMDTAVNSMIQLTVVFLVIVFSFYFIVIRPVINQFQSDFRNELDIPLMLPKDELGSFIPELRNWNKSRK